LFSLGRDLSLLADHIEKVLVYAGVVGELGMEGGSEEMTFTDKNGVFVSFG